MHRIWIALNKPGQTGRVRRFSTLLLTAGLLVCRSVAAQSGADPAQAASSDLEQTRKIPESSIGDKETAAKEYTESLSGGLIPMRDGRLTRLTVGATGSFGWDSNAQNLSNAPSSGVSTFSPYVGFIIDTARTQVISQYQPTFTRYTSTDYTNQTIHLGSFKMVRDMSPRVQAEGKVVGSHGQDSVRFLGPQQSVDVGGVAGTGSESATYLSNAGTSTNINATLDLHYRKSERDTVSFGLADGFSRYSAQTGTNSVAIATVGYDRVFSPKLTVLLYGQGTYYYGTIECTGAGGGVGFKWQFSERSFVSVSGGPQLNSSACKRQQGFSFNSAGGFRATGKSQLYFSASRQPSVSYLGGGLWQTSVSGGYQRQLGTWSALSLDVSHVTSSALAYNSPYSGFYIAAAVTRHLGHMVDTSLTYRNYQGTSSDSTSAKVGRNVVMFSVAWTPQAGHISW